jgi:hypothetical protein
MHLLIAFLEGRHLETAYKKRSNEKPGEVHCKPGHFALKVAI